MACIVATRISENLNFRNGASAMTSMIVEQFGFVTINPSRPASRWTSISPRCSGLTSGTTRGTIGSIRCELALLQTAMPASANVFSTSIAISAGSAEKTRSTPFIAEGVMLVTLSFAIFSGNGVSRRQFTTLP